MIGGQDYIDLRSHRTEDGSVYEPRLWNTKEPYLYRMVVETKEDRVESYFALRTIEIKGISMDIKKHEVKAGNEEVTLTLKEYELLKRLLQNH